MNDQKVINILLLGETGVGKSTFINAFANYCNFETIDEALMGEIITLIGTSLTLMDDDLNEITFNARNDENELHIAGQSSTQKCKTYIFTSSDNILINIIDTPGIGDTRGIQQDKKNFEEIFKLINQIDSIHAVCILLKANISRLTREFLYCLNELLSQLHQNVTKNMIFIFTHSKSVNYKPAEAIKMLKEFSDALKKKPPHVDIKFTREKVFFLENESFKILSAYKEKQMMPDESCDYASSWNKSSLECKRMINFIFGLDPHKVSETVNVNKIRYLLEKLLDPLMDITEIIDLNLNTLEKHKKEVEKYSDDIERIKELMNTPYIELETKPLGDPHLVCTSTTCTSTYIVGNIAKTFYPQICCPECGPWKHLFGHGNYVKFIKKSFMGEKICSCCHCPDLVHKLVYSQTRVVEKRKNNQLLYGEVTSKEKAKETSQLIAAEDSRLLKSYERERITIAKALAKFTVFLEQNAIGSYIDRFEQEVKRKTDEYVLKNEFDRVSKLNILLDLYRDARSDLIGINSSFTISTFDILKVIDELSDLEKMGKQIKNKYLEVEKSFGERNLKEETIVKIKLFLQFKK
jgi:GTP-binding protein EngB required for normal cell division